MNTQEEFNNICDRWKVLCAIMMSKGYFPTVAREIFFTAKKIKEEGYSDELSSEFTGPEAPDNIHFKAIKYGIWKEYKSIMRDPGSLLKNDDLSQAFVKEFLISGALGPVLTNKTTLLLEGRHEIPDDFINRVENKLSDKAREIYIDNFA